MFRGMLVTKKTNSQRKKCESWFKDNPDNNSGYMEMSKTYSELRAHDQGWLVAEEMQA